MRRNNPGLIFAHSTHDVKESSRAGEVAEQGANVALITAGRAPRQRLCSALVPPAWGDGPRRPAPDWPTRSPRPTHSPWGRANWTRQYPQEERRKLLVTRGFIWDGDFCSCGSPTAGDERSSRPLSCWVSRTGHVSSCTVRGWEASAHPQTCVSTWIKQDSKRD